ncbi:FAD-dependent oxidoreductase [Henriciella aquimarina]|uniref:FAD-dependent oxidoreductase n=1 Tax=Henriciella aquimarina TaxID=545261 RepID=UPI0009FD7433|nr:FAD-dependent oxidoreductase [Henriciella aquimarina]
MKHSASLPSVGIIGGGPAGLSLARLLHESGAFTPTVFESEARPGGKSFSFIHGESVVEMGTCYTTRAHHRVLDWMGQADIDLRPLGEQLFDGEDFLDYVKRGPGAPLAVQTLRFLLARRRLVSALKRKAIPHWAEVEAAQPVSEWLRRRKLHKIERFMYRSLTNLGYGFVDETPTVQALRWNDLDLILTGLLKQLKMPVQGWTTFWEGASAGLDVRLGQPVKRLDRSGDKPVIVTAEGAEQAFDMVVCSIPLDDLARIATLSENEQAVADAIHWNGYTTTLVAVEDWFTDVQVQAYSSAVLPGSPRGRMLSARLDGHEADLGGHLYLTGQLTGDYTGPELEELLRAEITERGGHPVNVILQKRWKYFARYDRTAVENGLLRRLRDMQGEQDTWYTGSTFSHEAVSNIVNFNAKLVQNMQGTG